MYLLIYLVKQSFFGVLTQVIALRELVDDLVRVVIVEHLDFFVIFSINLNPEDADWLLYGWQHRLELIWLHVFGNEQMLLVLLVD